MKTCISAEHLAAYRKTFGWMSTAELRAVVEGRKPHRLSEETLEALRLLLAQRPDGGHRDMGFFKPLGSEKRRSPAASQMDENDKAQVKCRKCRQSFTPDLMSKNIHWPCPHCGAKNQNLKRHYRSIAILCVLGLIGIALWMSSVSETWEIALAIADAILILLTARAIYRSETPWADFTVKVLVRVVFYSAFFFNVVIPLLWGVSVNNLDVIVFMVLPRLIVYAVVFPYLFWLEFTARRCAVPRVPRESYSASLKPRTREETRSPVANLPSAEVKRDTKDGAPNQQLAVSGRRRLLAGLCVLFLIAMGVLALPATRDELRWLRVSDDESVADEQAYLDAWPDGRHAGEARSRIQRQAWSVAVGLDSIEGFQAYLDAVPEGEHVAEAQARIEALNWEASVTANDIKHFEGFLRDYPDSRHADEARWQIDILARQQALEAIQRIRRIRSQLTEIYVLEGAGGDGTGRDWQNACGSLKMALEDKLTPGARIHVAAGLIQESVAIPDNTHLVCGYGRNAKGMMELNPRSHPVWLMPTAGGSRSMTLGRGCQLSGLWLGQTTLSALNALHIKTSDHVYVLCALINGPAKLELSSIGITTESDGDFRMEEYEPRSRQFTSTIWGTGSVRIGRAGEQFNINSGGTGASIHIERAEDQFASRALGTGGALRTEYADVQTSARQSSPDAINPQASFATPPGSWPPIYGDLNGVLELQVKNPNEFSVRVGLRSGGKGKDFVVPAYGTQSVSVPSGYYVTYFQYSSNPGGMYQGDSFTLRNNETTQITITKVVNGNYAIRKVN